MIRNINEKVKTVSAVNAETFDEKLNKALTEFAKKGISYELRLAPELGFTAFIVYREATMIPETVSDEFEMNGETHRCIECPFYVRPTDGRVKWTRCEITSGLHSKDSYCCDEFYKRLLKGEIKLVEVMDLGKDKKRKKV